MGKTQLKCIFISCSLPGICYPNGDLGQDSVNIQKDAVGIFLMLLDLSLYDNSYDSACFAKMWWFGHYIFNNRKTRTAT